MRMVGNVRRAAMYVYVLSLCVLGLGAARGAVIFSEDFETYTDGGYLDNSPNPNGWAYWPGNIYVEIPWGLDYGFDTTSTARTYLDEGSMKWQKKDYVTRSAVASLPAKNSGQLTLTFDLRWPVGDPMHSGIRVQDSTTEEYVNIFSAYGAWFLDTSADTVSFFGDTGAYPTDVQYATVTLDLDTGTVLATVTCANPIYGGSVTSSSGTLALPSGFVADQILLWNSNVGTSPSCAGDNIAVDWVPEPATLGLLAVGGVSAFLRRPSGQVLRKRR